MLTKTRLHFSNNNSKVIDKKKQFPEEKNIHGGLALIGKTAVLKTAGFTPMGVRVPHPPQNWRVRIMVLQQIANLPGQLPCGGSSPLLSAQTILKPLNI